MIWFLSVLVFILLVLIVFQSSKLSRFYEVYYDVESDVRQRLELQRMTNTFTVSSDMVIKELEGVLEKIEELKDEL